MGKHLIFVGGGHAHMTALLNLGEFIKRGHKVTLISPSPYHYYSGMGPGMLSGIYRPEEIRFHIRKMAENRGASFVEGAVVRVDPIKCILVLSSGDEIGYEVVSFNTGSYVPVGSLAGSDENAFTVKPITNLQKAKQTVLDLLRKREPRLVVIGGGPAGLEISGNLWRLVHDHGAAAHITVLAGPKFLPQFPEKVFLLATKSLRSRGIEVVEGAFVNRLEHGRAFLEDGREFPFDLVFLALGVRPSEIFRDSGLPIGKDGGLLVNDYLQSMDYPGIFGGGDCISFQRQPLDKVGVYAVRQNPILYHNLMMALEGGTMKPFDPGGEYMLIFNLGNGTGIFRKKNWVWNGRLAFKLKDYIDRKFMRRFQVSGERNELAY
jgi:NADH dehydrogenase FAD-containing subunit